MTFVTEYKPWSKNKTVYCVGDGFHYFASHKTRNSRVYLQCVQRCKTGCKGRASMPKLPALRLVEEFRTTNLHNHGPDQTYMPLLQLRTRILERCRVEKTKILHIYNQECSRFPPEVSSQLNYKSFISTMTRAKKGWKTAKELRQENAVERNNTADTKCEVTVSTSHTEHSDNRLVDTAESSEEISDVEHTDDVSITEEQQSIPLTPQTHSIVDDKVTKLPNSDGEPKTHDHDYVDFLNLKSAIIKLEAISDKLANATLNDSFESFGKYISSLLRGLPVRKADDLKLKIISDVLNALSVVENKTSKKSSRTSCGYQRSIAPTVQQQNCSLVTSCSPELPSPASSSAVKQPLNITFTNNTTCSNKPKTHNNVLPATSSANDRFKIHPEIRPLSAFSVHKPTLCQQTSGGKFPLSSSKTSSAPALQHISKGDLPTCTTKTSSATTPFAGSSEHNITNLNAAYSSAGRDCISSDGDCLLLHPLRDIESGFEMDIDIEDGNELIKIKQEDLGMFETVVCDSIKSKEFQGYVKEEVIDPEDTLKEMEGIVNASPTYAAQLISETTEPLSCNLYSTHCATTTELTKHWAQMHSAVDATVSDTSQPSSQSCLAKFMREKLIQRQ